MSIWIYVHTHTHTRAHFVVCHQLRTTTQHLRDYFADCAWIECLAQRGLAHVVHDVCCFASGLVSAAVLMAVLSSSSAYLRSARSSTAESSMPSFCCALSCRRECVGVLSKAQQVNLRFMCTASLESFQALAGWALSWLWLRHFL